MAQFQFGHVIFCDGDGDYLYSLNNPEDRAFDADSGYELTTSQVQKILQDEYRLSVETGFDFRSLNPNLLASEGQPSLLLGYAISPPPTTTAPKVKQPRGGLIGLGVTAVAISSYFFFRDDVKAVLEVDHVLESPEEWIITVPGLPVLPSTEDPEEGEELVPESPDFIIYASSDPDDADDDYTDDDYDGETTVRDEPDDTVREEPEGEDLTETAPGAGPVLEDDIVTVGAGLLAVTLPPGLPEESLPPGDRARLHHQHGDEYLADGDHAAALEEYERGLEVLREEGASQLFELVLLFKIAHTHDLLGDSDNAQLSYGEYEDVFDSHARTTGQPDKMPRTEIRRFEADYLDTDDKAHLAYTMAEHVKGSDPDLAAKRYKRAARYFDEVGDRAGASESYEGAAEGYRDARRYDRALELVDEWDHFLSEGARIPDAEFHAVQMRISVLEGLDRFAEAAELAEEQGRNEELLHNWVNAIGLHETAARLNERLGDLEAAANQFAKALRIALFTDQSDSKTHPLRTNFERVTESISDIRQRAEIYTLHANRMLEFASYNVNFALRERRDGRDSVAFEYLQMARRQMEEARRYVQYYPMTGLPAVRNLGEEDGRPLDLFSPIEGHIESLREGIEAYKEAIELNDSENLVITQMEEDYKHLVLTSDSLAQAHHAAASSGDADLALYLNTVRAEYLLTVSEYNEAIIELENVANRFRSRGEFDRAAIYYAQALRVALFQRDADEVGRLREAFLRAVNRVDSEEMKAAIFTHHADRLMDYAAQNVKNAQDAVDIGDTTGTLHFLEVAKDQLVEAEHYVHYEDLARTDGDGSPDINPLLEKLPFMRERVKALAKAIQNFSHRYPRFNVSPDVHLYASDVDLPDSVHFALTKIVGDLDRLHSEVQGEHIGTGSQRRVPGDDFPY